METRQSNGIEYTIVADGTRGLRAVLYPIIHENNEAEVSKAKTDVHRKHKLLSLQIRWRTKDEEITQSTIPDYIMVGHLSKEVGMLRSHNDELQHEINTIKQLSPEESKEIKTSAVYKEQQSKITELNKRVRSLEKDKQELIIKNIKLQGLQKPS
jgi:hypothetical protein